MGKKSKKGKESKKTKSEATTEVLRKGQGKFTFANGDVYEGEFCAHKFGITWREGLGTYTTHDGQIYTGLWKDDKLIENQDININYPNGSEYNGKLYKNKYRGAGVYKLENDLKLCCEFTDNQPTGDVLLMDNTNHIWMGKANKDMVILQQENIYYSCLCIEKGKGDKKKEPEFTKLKKRNLQKEKKKPSESQIFAKSTKTLNDIDFTQSKWYQNYYKFKTTKDHIKAKLEEAGRDGLNEQEKQWWNNYLRYKLRRAKEIKEKEETQSDNNDLLDYFYSEEFRNSCPPLKVFYPSADWDKSYDPEQIREKATEDYFDMKTSEATFKRVMNYYEREGTYDACLSINIPKESSIIQ